MDERISTIKSLTDHIRGVLFHIKQQPGTELKVAVNQYEHKLKELEDEYLPNITKALK